MITRHTGLYVPGLIASAADPHVRYLSQCGRRLSTLVPDCAERIRAATAPAFPILFACRP